MLLLSGAGILPTFDEIQSHYQVTGPSPYRGQDIYSFVDEAGFRDLLYVHNGKTVMLSIISPDLRKIPTARWPGYSWLKTVKARQTVRERLPFGSYTETMVFPGNVELHKHFVAEGMDAITLSVPD